MILKEKTKESIKKPSDVFDIISAILNAEEESDQMKEHLWAIGLNSRNMIQYVELVSLGTINESLIHPREVFRSAIIKGAVSLIIAHNHPSEECAPSEEDITITKRLKEAGKIIGISLLDHVIVGGKNYQSLNNLEIMNGGVK